jgi:hypothetical protein
VGVPFPIGRANYAEVLHVRQQLVKSALSSSSMLAPLPSLLPVLPSSAAIESYQSLSIAPIYPSILPCDVENKEISKVIPPHNIETKHTVTSSSSSSAASASSKDMNVVSSKIRISKPQNHRSRGARRARSENDDEDIIATMLQLDIDNSNDHG